MDNLTRMYRIRKPRAKSACQGSAQHHRRMLRPLAGINALMHAHISASSWQGALMYACMRVHAQIFVFFPEEDKVGVKSIKTFAERMRNEGVSRALMVTQANMTPFARQCLAEMQPKYYIEVVRALPIIGSLACMNMAAWPVFSLVQQSPAGMLAGELAAGHSLISLRQQNCQLGERACMGC